MQVPPERILKMLKKVYVLREQLGEMCLAKQGPVLSVMDLHYVVEQVYGLTINMIEVDFAAVYLRGQVERYSNDTARVLVRASLKDRDKRLTAVKELSHLALDEEDDWSADGAAMVDALIEENRSFLHKGSGIEQPTSPQQSEALALLAAIELMYPYEYRADDMAKLKDGATTISAIALHHDVPPFVIDLAFECEEWLPNFREVAMQQMGVAA